MQSTAKPLIVACAFLCLLASDAFAERKPVDIMQKQGRTDAIKEKLSEDGQGEDLIFRNTLEFDNTLRKSEIMSDRRACQAILSMEYFESDSYVRVATKLENNTCAASSGLYQIEVKTIGAGGNIERETYTEEWHRLDDQAIIAEHKYPLKSGVELLKTQSKLRSQDACWCEDSLSVDNPP